MSEKEVPTVSPDDIFVAGSDLRTHIYARCQKIEKVHASLLEEITTLLKKGAGEDGDPVEVAAVVLVALHDNHSLSGHALAIRAMIERAAQLQSEQRDLVRFSKNLMPDAVYKLSWSEADKFGY